MSDTNIDHAGILLSEVLDLVALLQTAARPNETLTETLVRVLEHAWRYEDLQH